MLSVLALSLVSAPCNFDFEVGSKLAQLPRMLGNAKIALRKSGDSISPESIPMKARRSGSLISLQYVVLMTHGVAAVVTYSDAMRSAREDPSVSDDYDIFRVQCYIKIGSGVADCGLTNRKQTPANVSVDTRTGRVLHGRTGNVSMSDSKICDL